MLTRPFTLGFLPPALVLQKPMWSSSQVTPKGSELGQHLQANSKFLNSLNPSPPAVQLAVIRGKGNCYLGLSFPVCKTEIPILERGKSLLLWINYSRGPGRTLL